MKKLSYLFLYPASLGYGAVVGVRNYLFDKKYIKTVCFNIPVINVGNLSVGGTGKTPHTEYILSILQKDFKTAVLSRGYKRKTSGFLLADEQATAESIGDEPMQIHLKFPNTLVAVDERRVHGMQEFLKNYSDLDVVILDDAFQHRYIKAGLSVLLTDYHHIYTEDFYLPAGRLRDSKKSYKRADIVIVTKCPSDIQKEEIENIIHTINPLKNQSVFFSTYQHQDLKPVFSSNREILDSFNQNENKAIMLVSGIASPQLIVDYFNKINIQVESLRYSDHHNFTDKDVKDIRNRFEKMNFTNKIIVVTEKDASRLLSNKYFPEELKNKTFALPIQVKILNNEEKLFTDKILDYVTKNSRNC